MLNIAFALVLMLLLVLVVYESQRQHGTKPHGVPAKRPASGRRRSSRR